MASKKENENFTENSGTSGNEEKNIREDTGDTTGSRKSSRSSASRRREYQEETGDTRARFYDRPGSFRDEEERYGQGRYPEDYRSGERETGSYGSPDQDRYYQSRRGDEGWYERQQGYGQFERRHEGPSGNEGYGRPRNRMRSMNFEKYAEEGNRFVNEVAFELGTRNRDKAARILRAVLHAVRDRLPAHDAVQFAQGLPMALKGIFIDQYDISDAPVVIRNKEDFIDFIVEKDKFAAAEDFPHPDDVVWGLKAVFRVFEYHMDPGQVSHIKKLLHSEIVDLIDG
jgi:uncharacterized protein (DUF2267 family)